jgi:hypothetical protein
MMMMMMMMMMRVGVQVVNWRGVLVAGGWFSAASGKVVANVAAWDGSAWWQLNELFTPSALLQLAAGESEVQPVSLDCGQQVSCTVDSGEIFDLYPQGNDLYFTQAFGNSRRRSVGRGGPVINQGASLGVFRSSYVVVVVVRPCALDGVNRDIERGVWVVVVQSGRLRVRCRRRGGRRRQLPALAIAGGGVRQ